MHTKPDGHLVRLTFLERAYQVNRRLPLFLGAVAFAASLGVSTSAEAGRGRFGGGVRVSGGFRFSGGVSVGSRWHFSRPAWRPHHWNVGGSIYVGPRYTYYPRPYYVYYPTYVPSYYHTESYYPVAPVAAPGVVAVVAPRQPLPRLGVGLFAGGSQVEAQDGGSMHESDDVGLLARFRLTPGLIIEGEVGKTSFDEGAYENVRVDRRLGASLLYEIGAYNRWAPYVLAGTGVQQAEVAGGAYETTQNFVEVGLGIRWALSRQVHIAFDLRAGTRATLDETTRADAGSTGVMARTITPPSEASEDSEEYTRGRLSAILYF